MTGYQFDELFDAKIDKAYSAFLNTVKRDALFNEALILSVESKYKTLVTQSSYDDISSLIKTKKKFLLNNNFIYTAPIQIASILPISPIEYILTTAVPHNFVVDDVIVFSQVQGFIPSINGWQYSVTQILSPTACYVLLGALTGAHISNTGQIDQHQDKYGISKLISDYNHLLTLSAKYSKRITNLFITNATNTSPITITINSINNNIKTGELITISGIIGNTNANGTFYVKKTGSKTFELYLDKEFLIPSSGNYAYRGNGNIYRSLYNTAIPLFSYRKISDYDNPTVDIPAYEREENGLSILPHSSACTEITADYISSPVVKIISTDTAINLSNTYSEVFLITILNKAVDLFSQRVKDTELFQSINIEENKS